MPWAVPSPLLLHHGTTDLSAPSISAGVDPAKGNLLRDFSRGFYTTTRLDQAATHARNALHRFRAIGAQRAMVFTFTVDRDAISTLTSLVFLRPTTDYWDFVDWCRAGNPNHHGNGYYDVVYGPVSESYRDRTVHEGFDQVSFHNPSCLTVLSQPLVRVAR